MCKDQRSVVVDPKVDDRCFLQKEIGVCHVLEDVAHMVMIFGQRGGKDVKSGRVQHG